MNAGLIGGIVGCVLGAIGGLIGTWATIRRTAGPRERAFAIRASLIGWAAAIIFLVLLLVLPRPWRWALWVPYVLLLPLAIMGFNRIQQRIRREESPEPPSDDNPPP